MRKLSPTTQVFLGILAMTLLVWILRGVRLFAFLPSSAIWGLLLLTIGAGVIAIWQGAQ
ncbi:hypothetical protein [Trichothermofontia sp.]